MHENIDDVLVVKVGTSTLMKTEEGREGLNHKAFQQIGQQVLRLKEEGQHVVIFSSGAVSAGMQATGSVDRPNSKTDMPEIQRLASIGWRLVLNAWDNALSNVATGGILVTRRELDLSVPERDEVLLTTHSMLNHGDIPILNENDPIMPTELYGKASVQNDILAATFAAQVGRSALFGSRIRLVMLSDVDGFYADARDCSTLIREVTNIHQYAHYAKDTSSKQGSGGMKTKLEAALIATKNGVDTWIANGQEENAVVRALNGEIGTHFICD